MSPETAGLVIHDLKNELGALEATLQRLAMRPEIVGAEQAHHQCQDLRSRLVSFLTLYGKADDLRAHCEDESPAELLASLRTRCAVRAPTLVVRSEVEAEVPAFWYFDRRLVTLALEAALHNARRFAKTSIWLGARVDDDRRLVFTIDDDGQGLGHGTDDARRAPHATGLGTQLCRAVAHAHGLTSPDGGVRLTNRARGGARFELRLPT